MPVTSGVPQGSVLRHVLFITYINNIDLGLNNFIRKFANNKKINMLSQGDGWSLKEDSLKKSDCWVNWEMPFNISKCQILHVGSRNIKNAYEICNVEIKSIHSIKDLGLHSHLNSSFPSSAASPLKSKTGWWTWLREVYHSRIKMLYYFCLIVLLDLIQNMPCSFGLPIMQMGRQWLNGCVLSSDSPRQDNIICPGGSLRYHLQIF